MARAAVRTKRGRARRRTALVHESFLDHGKGFYLKVAVALASAAITAYALVDAEPARNGGSWLGYTLGTIGALLILWLAALGLRKRAITPGAWSLKAWTSAHVYLGIALVVVATLHTGFQFGWNVHTLAYALMMAVVASGLYGISAYARLPRRMSENRGQTTQLEMIEEIRALDRELAEAARPLSERAAAAVRAAIERTRIGGSLSAKLRGEDPRCPTGAALDLLKAMASEGERTNALIAVIALLERKQALLARARQHIRYRTALELWLYVHVPATFALLAALTAHIVSVFFYW